MAIYPIPMADMYSYFESSFEPEDFLQQVESISHEYDHLIDNITAAIILARKSGIKIPEFFTMYSAREGMKGIMPLEIVSFSDPVEYTRKGGEKGTMVSARIAYATLHGKLEIWSSRIVSDVLNGILTEGPYIVHGIKCKDPEKKEFALERGASFTSLEPEKYKFIQKIMPFFEEKRVITSVEEILSLDGAEYSSVLVNLSGIVKHKGDFREFEKNGRILKLQKLLIFDGTGECEIVGWGNMAEKLAEIDEGDNITIINATLKEDGYSRDGVVISLNSRSIIKHE